MITEFRFRAIGRNFLLSVVLGITVVLVLSIYGNGSALLQSLKHFQWALLPAVLALTLMNYALRFVKWEFYLRQIGVRLDRLDSFAIFVGGLSMAITPGKVGEVLKPVLLKIRVGSDVSRTIPVVLAERLTDGIALILLAFVGLLLSHQAWQVLVASAVLSTIVVLLLGSKWGAQTVKKLSARLPILQNLTSHIEGFLESSRVLLTPRNLIVAIVIGVVSWSGESVAMYLILLGLGLHNSFELLIQSTLVLSSATLVGSLSMLPGGLGAADASVTGLLIVVTHAARAKAVAATLLIRFCTLWFGVALGLASLFVFRHRFDGTSRTLRDQTETSAPLMLPK